jgi:anti-anti-sigma regulatory factor
MPATAWSDFPVLGLQGPLDSDRTRYLLKKFEGVENHFRVTFSLKGVDFIDAGALSCFVNLHNRMRPNRELPGSPGFEASIRFVDVQPHVARVIRLVRLDELFELQERSAPRLAETRAAHFDAVVSGFTEAQSL